MYENLRVLTARKRSGKDYLTQALIRRGVKGYNAVVRLSFSDILRELANELFPWCPEFPSDIEKDQVINHSDNVLGLTPREVWLRLGDDGDQSLRTVDPSVLVNRFVKRHNDRIVNNRNILFIITDLRTPQEDKWLEEIGATKIRINDMRGEEGRKAAGIVENSLEDFTQVVRVGHEFNNYFDTASVDKFVELVNSTIK